MAIAVRPCVTLPGTFNPRDEVPSTCKYFKLNDSLDYPINTTNIDMLLIEVRASAKLSMYALTATAYDTYKQQSLNGFRWAEPPAKVAITELTSDYVSDTDYGVLTLFNLNTSMIVIVLVPVESPVEGALWIDGHHASTTLTPLTEERQRNVTIVAFSFLFMIIAFLAECDRACPGRRQPRGQVIWLAQEDKTPERYDPPLRRRSMNYGDTSDDDYVPDYTGGESDSD